MFFLFYFSEGSSHFGCIDIHMVSSLASGAVLSSSIVVIVDSVSSKGGIPHALLSWSEPFVLERLFCYPFNIAILCFFDEALEWWWIARVVVVSIDDADHQAWIEVGHEEAHRLPVSFWYICLS